MNTPKMTLWALMAALFFFCSTAAVSMEAEAQQVKIKGKSKVKKKKRGKKKRKKRGRVRNDFFVRSGLGVSGCVDIGSSCSELIHYDRAFTVEVAYRHRNFGLGLVASGLQMRLDAERINAASDQLINIGSLGANLLYFPSSQNIKTGTVDPWLALRMTHNDLRGPMPGEGFGIGLRGGVELFLQDSDLAVTPSINYDVIFSSGSEDPLHIWSAQIAVSIHWIEVEGRPGATWDRKPKTSSPRTPSTPKPRRRY